MLLHILLSFALYALYVLLPIIPAVIIYKLYPGQQRACWKNGHPKCVRANGTVFKGGSCCAKVDKVFKRIKADLHNLTPAIGELNADRSNKRYAIVDGELRAYGACDFEVGGAKKVTEPREAIRGDVARIWLYMAETYSIRLSPKQRAMFEAWSKSDPVDNRERLRDRRIEAVQGNRNPHIRP